MNNLTVGIGADISNLQAGIASATSSLSGFVSGANSRLQSLGDSFSNVGQKLSIGLSIPLGLLGKQALENGAGLESLKMGLKSIEEQQYGAGKSAEYAASRFSEFIEIAKLPGIGLKEAISMSIGLRSVGFSADEAKREILAFGNTLALVGKGKNELNGVALQLQQLSGKSSGFGADLRIIKEYAPQVGAALLQAFGTLDTESIAKTGVTGKQVIEKITTELEKLPKAGAGLKTAMENVSDSIFIATGRIGESLNKSLGLTSVFDSIGNAVGTLADYFTGLSPEVQKFIGITAGVLVIAPPLLIGLGGISIALSSLSGVFLVGATAIKTFATASILGMSEFVTAVTISLAEATTAFEFFSGVLTLNPIGAVIAGIVLLGGAMYGLSKIIGSTTKEVTALQYAEQQLNEVKKANYGTFETEISKTTALVSIIKSNVRSLEEKQGALNQLISISPKYFEGLTIEKIRAGEADEAIKKYTASIYENAITKGAESKISKLAEQLVAEKDAYDEATLKADNYRKTVKEGKTTNVGMGVYIKPLDTKEFDNQVNEAKKKVEQTDAALKKMAEFVAVRTVKTEGVFSPTKNTKPPTETDEAELKKAQKAREDFFKNTQQLLSQALKIENSLISDKYTRELKTEKQTYDEKVKIANQEKASTASKHRVLEALEKEYQSNISKIISDEMKGRSATEADGGLQGKGTKTLSSGLNIPNPLAGLTDKLNQSLTSVLGRFDSFAGQLAPKVQKMKAIFEGVNTGIQSSLQGAAASAFSGLGNIFGAMIAGTAGIGDAGKAIMGVIGNVFGEMGTQFSQAGVALLLLEPLIKNPFTSGVGMIAAGVALSALSGAISSTVSSGGTSGGGGSSYAQNYSSGSGSYGGGSQFNGGGERNQVFTINLTGKLTADGNDLSANLDRTIRQKARTYGGN